LLQSEERRAAAETAHIESETGDLDFAVFCKGTLFILVVAVVVILIVRLLTEAGSFDAPEAAALIALLGGIYRK
jgi:fumarate reductase subunit D